MKKILVIAPVIDREALIETVRRKQIILGEDEEGDNVYLSEREIGEVIDALISKGLITVNAITEEPMSEQEYILKYYPNLKEPYTPMQIEHILPMVKTEYKGYLRGFNSRITPKNQQK